MTTPISKPTRWAQEYDRKGIPSSFRGNPSGSVEDFVLFLKQRGIHGGTALDIGCGTGRNALYLADEGFTVFAMDFVPEIIDQLNTALKSEASALSVTPICHDVSTTWPLKSQSLNVAIDTFCFKHQIPIKHREIYRSELMRTLAPNAFFLLTLAGDTDGYYAQFLMDGSLEKTIVDPENQIPSVLYNKEEVVEFFSDLDLLYYDHKQKPSMMHGREYDRSTHVFIFASRDAKAS